MTIRNSGEDAFGLEAQAREQLVLATSGETTPEELQRIKDWCAKSPSHRAAFANAARLWRDLDMALRGAAPDHGQTINLEHSRQKRLRITRRAWIGGALAASAAGYMTIRPPLGLWPAYSELTSDVRTGKGGQKHIKLAGGARLDLNTKTSVNLQQTNNQYIVQIISGEAVVDNLEGQLPCRVEAGSVAVELTKASMAIRLDGQFLVTCLAGRFEVSTGAWSAPLRDAEQINLTATAAPKPESINPEFVASWREGLLVFDNETLSQVIAEVNRYRTGRIILIDKSLAEKRVTARFRLDKLQDVLAQLEAAFGASLTHLPGGVVLVS
jgi:transmembrane sensor